MKKQGGIVDLSNNSLSTQSITTSVFRYNYINSEARAVAAGSGEVSFYSMLSSAAISLAMSFVLYSLPS